MKIVAFILAAALPLVAAPAFGQAAPAASAAAAPAPAPAPAKMTTTDTDLGTLLDNPASKAVLQKYIPTMIANPQIDMARSMTLKQLQSYAADSLTDDTLAKIDLDLGKIPAAK